MDSGRLRGGPNTRYGLSFHCAQSRRVLSLYADRLLDIERLETRLGFLDCRDIGFLNDLRKYYGDCPKEHEAAAGLLRHCPGWKHFNRDGRGNEAGKRLGLVLSSDLSFCQPRRVRRGYYLFEHDTERRY